MNLNPISISTHGNLIIFGRWFKNINLSETIWEKLIIKWLCFKYEIKLRLRKHTTKRLCQRR